MIRSLEIREIARYNGVPESTVERDYAQSWLLKHLQLMPMVFKGGTAIRKAYIEGYRFSDDLDFTLLVDYEVGPLREAVEAAVDAAVEESGVNFQMGIRVDENLNGFVAVVGFRILRNVGAPINIKLDLSKPQNERVLAPVNEADMIHSFSDNPRNTVRVYALEEIMAEKMRSVFQRTRPRDLYDVWRLQGLAASEDVVDLFRNKCDSKNIDPVIGGFVERREDFGNAWETSLQHQIKGLPPFDKAFQEVRELLSRL